MSSSRVGLGEPASRYSRQERFQPIGAEGQHRISASHAIIVGCGALGTVAAELLARAGVGRLRIIDRDVVETSNLQRQFLFDEEDARQGVPKAAAAARRLTAVNSTIAVEPLVADLTPRDAEDLLGDADLILDATDNFETRYLVNDFAVRAGIPWIYAGAVGSYGLRMSVIPGRTACLRCIYPSPPGGVQPTCETAGVLGPLTAAIAALEAAEALRILSGHADKVMGDIATLDVWQGKIRQVTPPARDPECECCGHRRFVYLDGSRRAPISLCGRNAVQIHERMRPVDLAELARQLEAVAPGKVRANEFALRAAIEQCELTVFPDGRAIIKGTTDASVARGLYARYIGN